MRYIFALPASCRNRQSFLPRSVLRVTVNFPGDMLREVNEKLLLASIEQHELAEAARQAEARLAALINGVDAVICEADVASGEMVFVSDRADSFLGYPRAAWNWRGFWRHVILPEDRAPAFAFFKKAIRQRGVHEQEFRVVAAGGRVIWVLNRAVVVEDGGAAVLRCVLVDISAQKNVEIAQAKMLEREKRITEHLQSPLHAEFAEDAFPNLRVAAWYEPALAEAEVGGDFYDIFTVGDSVETRRTVLCVGDVVGKGLPAAALAARLKSLVQAYAFENPDPDNILHRLNNYQCHLATKETDPESRSLAGVAIAVVNCNAGTITVATAGMEPIIVISATGSVREVGSQGITIGIQANERFEHTVVNAVYGDTVLMTTDGLTEARRGGEFLGCDGMTAIALQHLNAATLTEMGNALVRDARTFGGRFSDDVCLVLMRCLKPPRAEAPASLALA